VRVSTYGVTPIDVEGYEHEVDEDIDEFFDKDSLKLQLELAVRMAEVARSVSEWHRRMTAEKLNQSGQPVEMSKYPVGTRVFFYKPPSKQEADNNCRRGEAHRSLCSTSESDKAHWHQISSTTPIRRSQWDKHHV
jgi:hypothetical protein